jgi:hypothetical protein
MSRTIRLLTGAAVAVSLPLALLPGAGLAADKAGERGIIIVGSKPGTGQAAKGIIVIGGKPGKTTGKTREGQDWALPHSRCKGIQQPLWNVEV